MWMEILKSCLSPDIAERAKNVDEILSKFSEDEYRYNGVAGSNVEAPKSIINGVMLHIMQGDEFGKCYRLPEIMQSPKRIVTVGREDNSVFNMIQLVEKHLPIYLVVIAPLNLMTDKISGISEMVNGTEMQKGMDQFFEWDIRELRKGFRRRT